MSSWARVSVVVALLGALTGCHGTSPGVSLAGDARSSTDAGQRATVLLNRVYVPGAVRSEASVVPPVLAVGENQVQAQRWFTVLGRASTIISTLKAQPPAGLEIVSPVFESTANAALLATPFTEMRPAGRRSSTMQRVAVAAEDLGGGRVGLRVQASVGWVGSRTVLETIPADVTDVQLALGFANQPDEAMNRSNQMTPAQISALTALLNSLPAAGHDQYGLCTQPEAALAAFTLSYGGHQALFDIQVGACDEVDVTIDGLPQPLLGQDQGVSQEVASILNLTLPPV